MKIISIINQKGGVAKTTTAHALASGLALLKNKKVLAIDLDPQCNLTSIFRLYGYPRGALDIFKNEPIDDCIQKTYISNLDLLQGHTDLASIDILLANDLGKNLKLKKALESLRNKYHYIIIDTPPSLSTLTVNALVASQEAIITSQADLLSIQGIYQLADTIQSIKELNFNQDIIIKGILITRYQSRTKLAKQVRDELENIAQELGTKVFKTEISERTVHRESVALNKSIFEYKPKDKGAKEYKDFIEEVIA